MLTKKTGRLFVFAALATATTFATEYTWTGNGNRGDWSDTANWSPSAIPGAGDKAVFVLSEDMTISTPVSIPGGDALDIHVSGANLTLSGVVSGEGKLCKSGDKRLLLMSENTYAGGTVISNGMVEIWNLKALGTSTDPVHLASDGGSSAFGRLQICANGDFGYPVFVDKNTASSGNPKNANLIVSNSVVKLAGAITGSDGGVLALRTIGQSLDVDATIDIPNGTMFLYANAKDIHFRKSVKVATMDSNNSTGGETGNHHWYSSDNEFKSFTSTYKNCVAKADDIFSEDTVLYFGWYEWGRSYYNLDNHDITVDRIAGNYREGDKPVETYDYRKLQPAHRVIGGTGKGSRITMRATEDTVTTAFFEEKITLVWWPYEYKTLSTYSSDNGFGRASTMEGSIIVSNGTFVVNGTNAFPNVSKLEIAPGAKFLWNSAFETPGKGLASLLDMTIESGASFVTEEGSVWPIKALDVLNLASDAEEFNIPEGTTLSVIELRIDGVIQKTKSFTSDDLDCLTGGGTLVCLGGGVNATAVWTGGGANDDIATDANWKGSVAPNLTGMDSSKAIFGETAGGDNPGAVSVSRPCVFTGFEFTGLYDVSFAKDAGDASVSVIIDGISCAAGDEERTYSFNLPVDIMANQNWQVAQGATLGFYGPLSTSIADNMIVTKSGAGTLVLYATNSTAVIDTTVTEGPVVVSGDNATGAAGSRLVLNEGTTITFNGGEYNADMTSTLGNSSNTMTFNPGTTNVFNGNVTMVKGHKVKFGENTLTEFNGTMEIGGWSYINGTSVKGKPASIVRFNQKCTFLAGQFSDVVFDLRASDNPFGNTDINCKYGQNITFLLNSDYAFNTTKPLTVWANNTYIDLCGHDNKVGTLELRGPNPVLPNSPKCENGITNSGEKATLWVVQGADDFAYTDNPKQPYIRFQQGDFAGPATLGKLGPGQIVFTNRVVSSTGDIIVNEGKVAFCPNSSWLGAMTVEIDNNTEDSNANVEIRQAETFNKDVTIHIANGGKLTIGVAGTDDSFVQRIGYLYIDGVRQSLGAYSADDGYGRPTVAGTIPCANLAGPGVLRVEGDRRPTTIIIK